jgi:hypothetical protein
MPLRDCADRASPLFDIDSLACFLNVAYSAIRSRVWGSGSFVVREARVDANCCAKDSPLVPGSFSETADDAYHPTHIEPTV